MKYIDWSTLDPKIQQQVAGARALNAASTLIGPNSMPSDAQINAAIAELVHALELLNNGGVAGISVSLSPSPLSLVVGGLVACSVSVMDATGLPMPNLTVALQSDNQNAAVVEDQTGTGLPSVVTGANGTAQFFVFGVAAGSANITGTTLGVTSAAMPVVVGTGTPSLSLLPATFSVATGGVTPVLAHLLDGLGNPIVGQEVDFQSNQTGIATVPATGITDSTGTVQVNVTGVAAGQAVITASALGVNASSTATVAAASGAASITIGYTDFLSGNGTMSSTAANAMMAFIASKTNHKWKIMNGLTPTGGYPANVRQIRYMLMEQTKCYDGTASIFTQQSDDYDAFCDANALSREDGYLHYLASDTTFADTIISIDSNGFVTMKYDTQTRAEVYAVGDQVTIAGSSNAACNGVFTVVGVQAPATAGGQAIIQVNATSGNTATGGTMTRTGDGTLTLRNRIRSGNPPFAPFWSINPKSSVRQQYELNRLPRVLAASYGYGVFIDSMSPNIFPATRNTVEYNPADESQWYTDLATLVSALVASMPAGPWRYTINTASYNSTFVAQLIAAAKSAHEESILTNHSPGNWPGTNQTFVAARLAAGENVEILNDVSVVDTETSFGPGLYATDPLPISGNVNAMAYTIQSWICALMVWDGGVGGGELAINLWNDLWTTPSADKGGIDSKWLGMLDYPFGVPTAASSTLVTGATDPLGQPVRVDTRAYGSNLVVYRTTSTGTTSWADAAAYTVTLPASTGAAGKWQRVKSDGTLDVAISTIDLHPMMGAMLVPAGGSVALAPASGSVAVGQTIPLTVTVLDASGNPVNAQTVTLTSSVPADATVPASVTTDSAGKATFNVTGVAAGASNITATANNVSSAASVITVTGATGTAADSIFAADSITGLANNAGVATWPNDADNTRNATQPTATLEPLFRTNVKNGLPMVFYPSANTGQGLSYTSLARTAITWFFVLYHPQGSSSSHHGALLSNPGYRLALLDGTSPYILQFVSHRSTTDGIWQMTTGVTLPGTIAEVSYDSSSVANAPIIKINGAVQVLTQVQAPVGTQISSAGTATIGNDPTVSAVDATYGNIGEITLWNGVLGAGDESTEGKRLGTKWAIANSY